MSLVDILCNVIQLGRCGRLALEMSVVVAVFRGRHGANVRDQGRHTRRDSQEAAAMSEARRYKYPLQLPISFSCA